MSAVACSKLERSKSGFVKQSARLSLCLLAHVADVALDETPNGSVMQGKSPHDYSCFSLEQDYSNGNVQIVP